MFINENILVTKSSAIFPSPKIVPIFTRQDSRRLPRLLQVAGQILRHRLPAHHLQQRSISVAALPCRREHRIRGFPGRVQIHTETGVGWVFAPTFLNKLYNKQYTYKYIFASFRFIIVYWVFFPCPWQPSRKRRAGTTWADRRASSIAATSRRVASRWLDCTKPIWIVYFK